MQYLNTSIHSNNLSLILQKWWSQKKVHVIYEPGLRFISVYTTTVPTHSCAEATHLGPTIVATSDITCDQAVLLPFFRWLSHSLLSPPPRTSDHIMFSEISELTMFTIRSLWWAPVTIQFLPFNMSHLQRNCSQFSLTVVVHNHAKTLPVENLYWKVAWAHLSTFDSYCHNPYFISTLL